MSARRLAPVLAAILATLLFVGGCSVPTRTPTGVAGEPRQEHATTRVVPTADEPDRVDETAVRGLFDARVAGLQRGDLGAWLLGVSGGRVREEQDAIYQRMRALHVADLKVVHVRWIDGRQHQAEVTMSYRFAGFDTTARRFAVEVSVVPRPGSTPGVEVTASKPSGRLQPWDLPGLQVRRSESVLVAASGAAARADTAAEVAATALRRVAVVTGPARPVVVVAPATDEAAAQLLGRSVGDLDQVAAVTDGPLDAAGRAGADRVVIVPATWSTLSRSGQEVVLTHELTHVTLRAAVGTRNLPLWLSEGLAEYVAYRGVRLPEATIVAPALDEARRIGLPTRWPTDAGFDPRKGQLSAAYGLALLACRTIADRHGQAALLRVYRAAASHGVEDAFTTIGTAEPAELVAWRERVSALLHQSGHA